MRKDFIAVVSESFSDFPAEKASLKILYPGPRIDHVLSHARPARLLSRTFQPLSGSRTNPSLLCGRLSRRAPFPDSLLFRHLLRNAYDDRAANLPRLHKGLGHYRFTLSLPS